MSITCPKCHRTSYNPNDEKHRFCAVCGYHADFVESVFPENVIPLRTQPRAQPHPRPEPLVHGRTRKERDDVLMRASHDVYVQARVEARLRAKSLSAPGTTDIGLETGIVLNTICRLAMRLVQEQGGTEARAAFRAELLKKLDATTTAAINLGPAIRIDPETIKDPRK